MNTDRLELIRGDTEPLKFTFKDDEGNPIDLTGCTVFFTVKKSFNDSDENAIISVETATHTAPLLGVTQIELEAEQMDAVETNRLESPFRWDVQIIDADGKVSSSKYGDCIIHPDVTRRIS